jgi:hypothetical protein
VKRSSVSRREDKERIGERRKKEGQKVKRKSEIKCQKQTYSFLHRVKFKKDDNIGASKLKGGDWDTALCTLRIWRFSAPLISNSKYI